MAKVNISPQEFRCEHRHSGLEHPNCWIKQRYLNVGITRIGYLDIEVTNLDANWGFVLTWFIKSRDIFDNSKKKKNVFYSGIITKKDICTAANKLNDSYDLRIIRDLHSILPTFNLLVVHYGLAPYGLDVPFVNTRFQINGFPLPLYRTRRLADTWKMSHKTYKLHSYRLETVGEVIGIEGIKTHLDGNIWKAAAHGNTKALAYIADHNKKDTILLEQVHKAMEAYHTIPGAFA